MLYQISPYQTKRKLYRLHTDHCIFMTSQNIQGPIIISFINNLNIFASARSEIMKQIKEELATAFDIVHISSLAFYFGLKVTHDRNQRKIKLLQPGNIEKLLN